MSSRAGSTFLTFLVSIPLAAMGLMVVFGVPPLASVIAATRGLTDSKGGLDNDSRSGRDSPQSQFEDWDSGTAPAWKAGDADLNDVERGAGESTDTETDRDDLGFSKSSREDEDSDATLSQTKGRRTSPQKGLDNKWADNTPSVSRPLLSSRGGAKTEKSAFALNTVPDRNTPPTSMKESLKKLNSRGVKHYHLERGSAQDTWLFVCLYVPGDDDRLTHRFEAESDDPDRAAAETVQQLESWLLQRFRDKQPISQNAM